MSAARPSEGADPLKGLGAAHEMASLGGNP
jgi:hypothetical protein